MDSVKSLVIEAASRKRAGFETLLDADFEPHGILNSEMLAVCATCEALGVEVVIESGRWRGQSTDLLSRYFADKPVRIESIEAFRDENAAYVESKLGDRKNLVLHYGDANRLLPKLAKKHALRMTAILLDGPKGKAALDLFRLALTHSDNIVAGFFHDMRKSSDAVPSEGRPHMEQIFPHSFFTDDEQFVELYSDLDATCGGGWEPYHIYGKRLGSYGPTIGIVLPTKADVRSARKERPSLLAATIKRRLWLAMVKTYHLVRPPGERRKQTQSPG